MDQHKKVYINPNFNKNFNMVECPLKSRMHVNPNFIKVQTIPNQPVQFQKIYVNPNFVRSNVQNDLQCIKSLRVSEERIVKDPCFFATNSYNTQLDSTNQSLEPSTSRSRYSLVRNIGKTNSPKEKIKVSKTIKINKYKLVPLKTAIEVKEPLLPKVNISQFSNQSKSFGIVHSPKVFNSRFKLIKGTTAAEERHPKIKKKQVDKKRNINVNKTSLKLNNIPCPLFRKYGKCLRNIHNKCQFVHDKKHVSLCRKFLKGLCFDKGCLLSHDVTDKKMPTCYFYLKGMCSKDACPYLHIKLNENAKICPDFSKGYCEKGEHCLHRHIAASDHANKNKSTKICRKLTNVQKIKNKSKTSNSTQTKYYKREKEKHEDVSDYRYYKDEKQNSECETIKPSRCKLGTLPSFIQL